MKKKNERIKVFLSYSHKDSEWAERLKAHLTKAESQGLVEYWNDQELLTGSELKQQIKNAINESKVFVILVSSDYFSSQFANFVELPLIQKAVVEGALILPVLINDFQFQMLNEFQTYQFINSQSLKSMPPRQQEQLIIEIAKKINTAISDYKKNIETNSVQVLASAIGGATIGNLLLPGGGGAIIGGLIGGVLGNANKGVKNNA